MKIRPITFCDACEFIDRLHRHHTAPQGHKFSLSVWVDDKLVGVACVGRPVARKTQSTEPYTCEITRLCTDGTPNACSKLYAACRRVAGAMGYDHCITFTMESELGSSLMGAGWEIVGTTTGKSWSVPSRQRADKHELGPRKKWRVET